MLKASLESIPARERNSIRKALEKELEKTATRGWSVDEETEEGIIAVAAPIFDASGAVLGAVGIVAPRFRMDKSQDRFINIVISGAKEATELRQRTNAP
jgi:DNA-binding IclR family transcriptional regulator